VWRTFIDVSLPLMRPGLANAFLITFIAELGCGYLVRELISRSRRSRERSRRYSSEMDAGPASVERRLEPLTEKR
jgi:hypothetical protein